MALRISRKVCTLGRPGALGVGIWGSMQDHSASERSVGYVFLIPARVSNYHLTTPFRTVSEGEYPETQRPVGGIAKTLLVGTDFRKPQAFPYVQGGPTAVFVKVEPRGRGRTSVSIVKTLALPPATRKPVSNRGINTNARRCRTENEPVQEEVLP